MKKGYISIVHLVYIIIIAVILLAFILVIAFGNTQTANTTMGTASTVSSLILSVIAIVMTITDVAGQRNTVSDIKESAEKLQSNLSTVNESIEEVGKLKEELMDSMREINISNQLIVKEILALKGKYEKGDGEEPNQENEKFVRDLDDLSERLKTVYVKPRYSSNNLPNYSYIGDQISADTSLKVYDQYISNVIYNQIEKLEVDKFTLNDILWICDAKKISRSKLKNELSKLVESSVLSREGEYYIRNK